MTPGDRWRATRTWRADEPRAPQNVQIWTTSVLIGIDPTSVQIGGSARVVPGQGRLRSVDEMLRIYDPIADSARVFRVVPTLVRLAHIHRFCCHRRAHQPAASESPLSDSRTAPKLRGYRLTALELTARIGDIGKWEDTLPLAAGTLWGGPPVTGRRPLARFRGRSWTAGSGRRGRGCRVRPGRC